MDLQQLYNQTMAAHQRGALSQAKVGYEKILAQDAHHLAAQQMLGALYYQLGEYDQAIHWLNRALHGEEDAGCLNNLGLTYEAKEEFQAAAHAYQQALKLEPDSVEVLSNLGNLQLKQGQFPEAEAAYLDALKASPQHAPTLTNLGYLYGLLKQWQKAEHCFGQVVKFAPRYLAVYSNWGSMAREQGRLEMAEKLYRHALSLDRTHRESLINLGNLLLQGKRFAEAQGVIVELLKVMPDDAKSYAKLDYVSRFLCDWPWVAQATDGLQQQLEQGNCRGVEPFSLLAMEQATLEQQQMVARGFGQLLCEHAPWISPQQMGAGAEEGKLRIGYLSRDMHEHPCMQLLIGVLREHDKQQFEIYGYRYGAPRDDAMSRRLLSHFTQLRDLHPLSDQQAAEQIAQDGVQILIDITGYTAESRQGILARRPAPVLVNWMGYAGTFGYAKLADYLLGDPIATPFAHQRYYSETLVHLKGSYLPNDNQREIGAKPSRVEAGLPAEGILFCCFNNSFKITPAMFARWCSLLKRVAGSWLWLPQMAEQAMSNLRQQAVTHGVDGQRILFAPRVEQNRDHLARLQLADIALDSFPYNSHATGCDILWAGVPLVARMGDTFASRVSASLLEALELPELIARSDEAYERLAYRLATDEAYRHAMRQKLVLKRQSAALFDTVGFTRHLEQQLQRIWQQQKRGERHPIGVSGEVRGVAVSSVKASTVQNPHAAISTQPTVRVLHSMARSGCTLISKCLASMEKVVLLSEVNPRHCAKYGVIDQAYHFHGLFSAHEMQQMGDTQRIPFVDAVKQVEARCRQQEKRLLLRDWSHIDFIGTPYVENPLFSLNIMQSLTPHLYGINTVSVRHPLDQWLSTRRLLDLKQVKLDQFLHGYRRFAELAAQVGFIHYEAFTADPDALLQQLCGALNLPFDSSYQQRWQHYDALTGDVKSTRGGQAITPLRRRAVEPALLAALRANADYMASLELLGYSDEEVKG
uniref:protein O-GlcNAc transferase n=1 Tax=Magnetococcus massalia (strain MO-1) TaxID=451514 RepID=A0A1S7LHS8_MAGMO|nr:putative GT41 : related to protein O-b-N-acetylglucosaminyltransferase [Candidatus Magnetococcus massalia]